MGIHRLHAVERIVGAAVRKRNMHIILMIARVLARLKIFKRARDLAHSMQRRQRNLRHCHIPLPVKINDARRFLLRNLAEGISHGRARVTNGVAPYALRPVQMTQRHIIECIEKRRVHVVQATQRTHCFRLTALRIDTHRRDKLMRHQNMTNSLFKWVFF